MPRDGNSPATAQANVIYRYRARIQGVDGSDCAERDVSSPNSVSETVWVRPPAARCDSQYNRGTITMVISDQAVECFALELAGEAKPLTADDGEMILIRIPDQRVQLEHSGPVTIMEPEHLQPRARDQGPGDAEAGRLLIGIGQRRRCLQCDCTSGGVW
ncbi:hypothetical protein M513_13080 [Trichuris suis]|uniref:Uncharacterized protein n=1 Tax=Trichuris suis TaxID=68888 RepID=A0A085LM44_9BILA|nr:hypothetical protein M513_13080 [Trichuris suis]